MNDEDAIRTNRSLLSERNVLRDRHHKFIKDDRQSDEYVKIGLELLTDLRSFGKYLVKTIERDEFSQIARDVADKIFEIDGEYYSVQLDRPDRSVIHSYVSKETPNEKVIESDGLFVGVPDFPTFGLVGRDELLETLIERLTTTYAVSVSTVGIGGVGKTALAVAAAYQKELLAHFRGGVLWASVGPDGDPLLELGRWAEVLGLDPSKYFDAGNLRRAVKDAIGLRRLLLVIDDVWNLEHAELLRCGGPYCAHLLTTRDNSIAAGFALGRTNLFQVRELSQESALEMLRVIAADVVEADVEAASELVRQVGGLPLAIELLGGYLAAENVPDPRLFPDLNQERIEALRDPAVRLRQANARLEDMTGQRITLDAVLALSLEGFADEELVKFYALGVFAPKPATFGRRAAEAISDAYGVLLNRFVDQSLLEINYGAFSLHKMLADLAQERLKNLGKLDEIQARHAEYYLNFINEDRTDWRRIDAIYEQVRWAWDRLGDDAVLDWVRALAEYQSRRGLVNEIITWHERGLRWARMRGERYIEGTLLINLGLALQRIGRHPEALALIGDAVSIMREVGDRAGEASALNNMAMVYNTTGRPLEALAMYEEALPIRREVGDRNGEAATLNNIAAVYYATGRPIKALAKYEEALPIRREAGDQPGEAATLNNMAIVYQTIGRSPEALVAYEEALPIMREVGDRGGEAAALNNMAMVYLDTGRLAEALGLYEEALLIMRELGDNFGEAATLNNMALVYHAIGRLEEALTMYEEALQVVREVGDRRGEARSLNNMAMVYDAKGRLSDALMAYEEALSIMREVVDRAGEATTLQNMAIVLRQLERKAEAIGRIEEALALFNDGLTYDAGGNTAERYEELLRELQE